MWLKGVPQGRLSDYADERDGISGGKRSLCCPDGEKADILRHTALEASVRRCAGGLSPKVSHADAGLGRSSIREEVIL